MKVLLFGLGSIGRKHVQAIKAIEPDADIFAVRSGPNNDTVPGVTNVRDISAAPEQVDFVVIANPTYLHAETISRATSFGAPLFIEKPALTSLDELPGVTEKIHTSGVTTYVACNLRFLESIRFVRERLHANGQQVLEVNAYCGSYLPGWRPEQDFRKSYSADPHMGGGVHLDLIHELDYLYWLFGAPQRVQRLLRSESTLSISAIDFASYSCIYPNFCANVVLNYYRRDAKRTCELICEDETVTVDLLSNEVSVAERMLFSSDRRVADTYVTQMQYFLACLNQKRPPMNGWAEAEEVLKICLPRESNLKDPDENHL